MYSLKRKQHIPHSRQDVFNFFKSPENLEKITPSDIGFKILTPKPIKMQTGAVLDYTINLIGFKIRWTTLITDFQEPQGFADVSLKSPYSYWYHKHHFVETKSGTVMYDEINYSLPFGILGKIAHSIWVKRELNKIFDYRAEVIDDIFKTKLVEV